MRVLEAGALRYAHDWHGFGVESGSLGQATRLLYKTDQKSSRDLAYWGGSVAPQVVCGRQLPSDLILAENLEFGTGARSSESLTSSKTLDADQGLCQAADQLPVFLVKRRKLDDKCIPKKVIDHFSTVVRKSEEFEPSL